MAVPWSKTTSRTQWSRFSIPQCPYPGRNLLGLSLLHGQRADRVDHLHSRPLGATAAVLACDPTILDGSGAPWRRRSPPPRPGPTVREAPSWRGPHWTCPLYPRLGQDRAAVLVQGRQEVRRRRRLPLVGAAHGLAVHGDDSAAGDGAGARVEPRRQVGINVCGVQVLEYPADGGLRGQGLARLKSQGLQVGGDQVTGVPPDGCQAPAACEHSGHGQGQGRGWVMTYPAPVAGVGDAPENLGQGPA